MPPLKADLPAFTGLRGIAALLVLFFHVRTPIGAELTFGIADPFSVLGFLGVDLFFVLSGFILSHVYGEQFSKSIDSEALKEFAVARFARIYPLHVVTLGLMLIAYAVASNAGVTPSVSGNSLTSTILSLLLIQEWFGVVGPNPGAWSVSVELMNYIVFPFFVAAMAKMPRYWPFFAIVLGAIVAQLPSGTNLPHGVAEFAMGCAAYYAAKNYRMPLALPLSGAFFALPFLVFYWTGFGGFGFPALCFTASIYFLAISPPRDPFAWLCMRRPIVFIGEISYSLYLLQWFVWIGWKHVIGKLPFFSSHPYLMVTLASASLIALSVCSYYFFEKPCRSWLRNNLVSRPERAAA